MNFLKSVNSVNRLKVLLVGEENSGKTTFINALMLQPFNVVYKPTIGVKIYSFRVLSNQSSLILDIWDCGRGVDERFYNDANAAIVMYDMTDKQSSINSINYIKKLKKISRDICIIVCGNKYDLIGNSFLGADDLLVTRINLWRYYPFFSMSLKTNYNVDKPILTVLRYYYDGVKSYWMRNIGSTLPTINEE